MALRLNLVLADSRIAIVFFWNRERYRKTEPEDTHAIAGNRTRARGLGSPCPTARLLSLRYQYMLTGEEINIRLTPSRLITPQGERDGGPFPRPARDVVTRPDAAPIAPQKHPDDVEAGPLPAPAVVEDTRLAVVGDPGAGDAPP